MILNLLTKMFSTKSQIIVSSGGMLTQKLNSSDFNSEKMSKFDGTMIYAQNKRQQVRLHYLFNIRFYLKLWKG